MRRFLTIAVVFVAFILSQMSAMAYPTHESGIKDAATVNIFTFIAGDLEDSLALESCGTMSASFEFAGGTDSVSLYQLDDSSASAATGTLVKTFTADSTLPVVFMPARRFVKAVQTASDTGGSVLIIRCSNVQVASNSGRCSAPIALTASHNEYFDVGKSNTDSLEISFEPDAIGALTTAVLSLEMCSRETAASCLPYNFDTDADGLGDTNLLDGSTIEKSGVRGISGFRYLRVQADTNPDGSDEPEFTVCRRRSE